MRSALLILACCVALAAGERVAARLILPVTAAPGAIDVAVELAAAEGWHLYWSNPGDSGLPPTLAWQLPPGWRADPPRFPAPERYEADGLTSFVHHGRLVLLAALHAPPDAAGAVPLRLRVDWLVCKEACVPGRAELAGTLTLATTTADDPRIAAARAVLPAPAAATATLAGREVVLAVPADPAEPDVFPADEGVYASSRPRSQRTADGWLIHLPLAGGAEPPARFHGVVRLGGRALAIDAPITPRSPP